jgi:hypothetical protein
MSVNQQTQRLLKPLSGREWTLQLAMDLVVGAGFISMNCTVKIPNEFLFELTRIRSLPDTVAANMNLLMVGLNPSPYSADHSIGYVRPGNLLHLRLES